MAASLEEVKLHVEGINDQHSIIHLLIRHGISYDSKPWPSNLPSIQPIGGIDELLEGMTTAVKLGSGRTIGFVVDADIPLENRWNQIRDRLRSVGVDTPVVPPAEGFIGHSNQYKTQVGIWVMPDNVQDGALEHFLRTLFEENDTLVRLAEDSTDEAKNLGAKFGTLDRLKAIIHAWLAWQETPGLPYGAAMKAHFFSHRSDVADRFVNWFRRLYGV